VTKALEEVAKLLGIESAKAARLKGLQLKDLQQQTRNRLLEMARVLEIERVSKLAKAALAKRIHVTLAERLRSPAASSATREADRPSRQPSRVDAPPPREARVEKAADEVRRDRPADGQPRAAAQTPPAETDPTSTAKLDLGPAARDEEPAQHIPWSYGLDRVTAVAVSPDRLYVFWEVSDQALETARAGLGPGGPAAWLDLRVYDTTGLIFDGTNAHSYFDHRVERGDRQWFFDVGKPTSTSFVEIGMRSTEGFFVKIARSGRVEFPRKESATWSEPEWLTVVATAGGLETRGEGGPQGAQTGARSAPDERQPAFEPIPLWVLREPAGGPEIHIREMLSGGWERVEWHEVASEAGFELEGRIEWVGPHSVTTWESGPFTHPVEIQPPYQQEWQGRSFAYRIGNVTRVVYGPWQVVIRNLGARMESAVLGRWEVYRSWVAEGGRDVLLTIRPAWLRGSAAGASELLLGASERLWRGASELRLGGASEVWRLGASEVRLGGASERLFMGASQWMLRGASEQRFLGASEVLMRGASERGFLGGSEMAMQGASERLGASERHLGGSEQRITSGPVESSPYPPAPEANHHPAE
jgi:uncharacterized protein